MSFLKVAIPPRRSMALLAILTILMVMASYAFVLVLAAACVYLPYMSFGSDSPGFYSVAFLLFGIVIAATLLWSLVPRADKFRPPGPILERSSQPQIFAELDRIATALSEPLPQEVYLIGEVTAWVADRGGVMGFGSRRIMAVGLPLLSILSISEFRGVLAHEFAHYYGGDTSLGPWVYKTRTAIIRTFQNIEPLGEWVRIAALRLMHLLVTRVLEYYFVLFLRATNWVSRQQEFRADELASLVAGPQALIGGLRAIHGTAPAWQVYWNTEVVPVLNNGSIPAIGDGFTRFVAAPDISKQIETNLANEIGEATNNPYDTHPPLRDRIAATQKLPTCSQQQDTQPAHSLLDNIRAAELRLVETTKPALAPNNLVYVAWDDVGVRVMVPAWKDYVEMYSTLLQAITAETLPGAIRKLPEMGSDIRDPKGMLLTPAQRTGRAGQLLAAGFALSLFNHGWELHAQPGVFHLRRDNDQLNPFLVVEGLVSGKLTPEAWVSQCRGLGISQLPLSP